MNNSGLTIQCQIVADNLDCVLLLPDKYRSHIEGLAGNFNEDYTDDLVNRQTRRVVSISPSNSDSPTNISDADILDACLSCKSISHR